MEQLLQQASADCFRSFLMTLAPLEKQLADELWKTPGELATALKPYVSREDLELTPPVPLHGRQEALEGLSASIRAVKQGWFSHGVEDWLKSLGLKGNCRPLRRLQQMTEFCRGAGLGLEDELWEVYRRDTLQAALRKHAVLPEHPFLALLDEVEARREPTIKMDKVYLWHQVMQRVRARVRSIKERQRLLSQDDLLIQVREALSRSASLPRQLAQRWPITMIDEFQDTDSVQYDIFSRIYPGKAGDLRGGLMMIGDPKQAIYQFRGADVYAYINAKRHVDDTHSLKENWRSTPGLVEGVNTLFGKPGVFDTNKDIPFTPAVAAKANRPRKMTLHGKQGQPFELFIVGKPDEKNNKDKLTLLTMEYAAEQAVRLLQPGPGDLAPVRLYDDADSTRSLKAGDIAVLVRTWKDAGDVREALAKRGIKSVYLTRKSVLKQAVATDLVYLLQAVLAPADGRAVRAALATRLLQCTAEEIERLDHDEQHQQALTEEFQGYRDTWEKLGVATMLSRLLQQRQLAGKWLGQQEGDREITDFRHLAELLQQRENAAPGRRQLLNWFIRERQASDDHGEATEHQQLRLESDENLVKIVTMHAAKGLEYDVVIIPMPGSSGRKKPNEEKKPALYHEASETSCRAFLEVGDNQAHRERARTEIADEEMRLLYVALTRAKYCCYVGIPRVSRLEESTLGKLMQPYLKPAPKASGPNFGTYPPFDVVDGNVAGLTPYTGPDETEVLQAPPPLPYIDREARLHSYSSISARLRDSKTLVEVETVAGLAGDEPAGALRDEDSTPGGAAEFSRFTFPRGRHVGLALHGLLENLDPTAAPAARQRACERLLNRLGLVRNREQWREVLLDWIDDILKTPLGPAGVSLEAIGSRDRINEVEFHFPIDNPAFTIDGLRAAGYLQGLAPGSDLHVKGMMTGFIDLAFRHDGRYYVLDYKSNYLGGTFADYGPERLRQAIAEHHYDLQYLVYSAALHRWLRARSREYDYERDFGGVFYLFLRGLQGRDTGATGVHFHRPSRAMLGKFDRLQRAP